MDARTESSDIVTTRDQATGRTDWMGIAWYIVLAYGIAWSIWIGLRAAGVPFGVRTAIGMFAPALACVVVRLLRREGFADAGLRLAERGVRDAWRLYLVAYLVPIILLVVGVGISLLVGVQHWNLSAYLQLLQRNLPANLRPAQNIVSIFVSSLLSILTIGVVIAMIFTFGEELGWRGYLLPRLAPLGGVWAAIIVGIVWGLWHAPVIMLDRYEYNDPAVWAVLMFLLFTVPVSIIFAWLRFRTGSIWPTALAHAMINTAASLSLAFVTAGNLYLGAPIGVIGLLPFVAFAIWLIVTGRLQPRSPSL